MITEALFLSEKIFVLEQDSSKLFFYVSSLYTMVVIRLSFFFLNAIQLQLEY